MGPSETESLLKSKKLRQTPLRIRVLEQFLSKAHSAIQIGKLEEDLGGVDRITLYRTLKTFEKEGIIHKVIDGTQQTKYALCLESCSTHTQADHAHFLCESCGETTCLADSSIQEIALPKHYKINKVQIALSGTCANCV